MTRVLGLDPPRRIGAQTIAVLCERRVVAQDLAGAILARGHKIPVAVLIALDGAVTATDLTGRPLDPATLDDACPGLLQTLADAAAIPP